MRSEALATPAATSPWRSHGLLFLLAMMYADNFVGRQIVAVMIEPIKHEFGASDTSMGLISGLAFAAVFAVLGLPAGRLADRLPRIRAVAIALQTLLSTLFGVGFGPVLIGTLSDLLHPSLGIEALRHALLLGCGTSLGAMILLYRTGRHLPGA